MTDTLREVIDKFNKLTDVEKCGFFKTLDSMGGVETYTVGMQIDDFMKECEENDSTTYKTYITNCICPRCGQQLYTSDIDGYSFVCKECDENFYGMEIKEIRGGRIELSVTNISVSQYKRHLKELQELVLQGKCDFLGYDDVCNFVDVGWNVMSSEKQIRTVVDALSKIEW